MELEPRTTVPAHATGAVAFVPLSAVSDEATFRLRDPGDVSALAASIGRLGHLVPVELRPLPGAPAGATPRFQVVAGFRRLAALRLLARERVLARVHATLDDDDAWAIALAQALLGEPLQAAELQALRQRLAAAGVAPWADELVDEALVRAPVDPEVRESFLAFLAGAPAVGPDPRPGPGRVDEDEEAVAAGANGAQPATAGPATTEPAPAEFVAAEPATAEPATAGPVTAEPAPAEPEEAVEVTPDELAEGLAQRLYEVNQDLALAFDAWGELTEEGRRMIVEQARYVAELFPLLAGRR